MENIKKIFTFWLLWSWLISLPIVLVGGYWAIKTYERYHTFALRYEPGGISPAALNRYAQYEYDFIKRGLKTFFLSGFSSESELPVINIKVSQSELKKLNSHMPQSGFDYVNGTIITDGKPYKIKYRYRGDFSLHWAYHKKSIRIKTNKKALYHGIRSFNLLAPKYNTQVNNFLSYKLAEEMGLLVPRSELVAVTLNGKYIGTHIFVEQLEEMTLRHRRLMPGDIYRGEIVGKDKYLISGYEGRNLFDIPGFWDKMAINNHYNDDDTYPLKEMLSHIHNSSFAASQKGLSKIMDMEAWGRFSAFESLTNTYHFDDHHNWRIYYDPWRQKLVPIVWDPTGWLPSWRVSDPKDKAIKPLSRSALHHKLFQNGDFIRARNAALADFFNREADKKFVKFSNDIIDIANRESKQDPYLRPADDVLVREQTKKLGKYIERVMSEGSDYTTPTANDISFDHIHSGVRLSVSGATTVKRLKILFEDPIEDDVTVKAVMSMRGVTKDDITERTVNLSNATTISGPQMLLDVEFLSNSTLTKPGLLPHGALTLLYERGDYDLVFDKKLKRPKSIWVDIGQGWQNISNVSVDRRNVFDHLYNPIKPHSKLTPVIWKGSKTISGVVEIDNPLIIKPGTTVYLDENASLIIRNKLDVQGTAQTPVQFVRKDSQAGPWGTIALLGEKANSSNLTHCVMDGGSGYKDKLFEYSGMFSVHDVQGITIDNCQFRNGTIVDDMVHIVYSSIDLSNSLFDTCLSDALDIDISNATLNNVTFVNSGNDAVDLMSSTASIINSTLSDSGDKAISVGEGSHLLAVNNVLKHNEIGIQVKDGSKAFLYNQTITENVMAIDAYKKNWRYNGGGEAYLHKSVLADNKSGLTSDKNSQVTLYDSYIDSKTKNKKSLSVYSSDKTDRSNAKEIDLLLPKNMKFTVENLAILDSFNPAALQIRNPARRGAK